MQKMMAEGFRVSPQQKRVWSLQQKDGALSYRACCAVLIEGDPDAKALMEVWRSLVSRHEILRTTFQFVTGMSVPLQVISDTDSSIINQLDWRSLERAEQEIKLEALFQEALQLPLDLSLGPLAHLSLVALSSSRNILLLSLPALCADHVTLGNIVEEISRSYAARKTGAQRPGSEPVQYADISEYLNELLESEETEGGRTHWREKNLSHAFDLKLPFESQPPAQSAFDPRITSSVIAPDMLARVESLARSRDVSASLVLQACWQILLWRLTGQTEIVTGALFDGRAYAELEKAIGPFAKYLPITSHLNEEIRFDELLAEIAATASGAREWQDYYNWEDVAGPHAEQSGHIFFPFSFDFIKQPPVDPSVSGPSFSIYRQYACIDRFRLKLCLLEKDAALLTELHYDAAYLSSSDAERMAEQFYALVESVLENPSALIGELNAVGRAERRRLLFELNQTEADYPRDKVVQELFEEQVERTPHGIAVVYEDEKLSYGELNERANRLAHYLRRQGVAAEARVGILMERSLEMVIAMLAVLKAGAAYVPLDPAYPEQRLRHIIKDAGLRVMLTQEDIASVISEDGMHLIRLDAERTREELAGESAEKPLSVVRADNLAYILYTSGSTGVPKGVMISHSALCNHMFWMLAAFPLSTADRILQKTPISFDASVWEFYAPLLTGAQLVMARPRLHTDAAYLVRAINQHQITILQLVPTMLRVLLEEPGIEECQSLRHLFCGGEALPATLSDKFFAVSEAELHNLYGPTEATIEVAFWTCERGAQKRVVPIGRPISNTQIYVLDERQRPVPTGAAGELYIGGECLARGYLNNPALTAERFIPDPFGSEAGARLYRTGDMARYLTGGELEYIGRFDGQVKLRGFRIELGEIEAVLASHEAVSECAVVIRGEEGKEKSIVAYTVAREDESLATTTSELRRWLKQRLPEYMLPTAFVPLKQLPLLPNGKVDRRALPAPDQARPQLEEVFVAPQTAMEKTLAEVWSQVLKVEAVGIHDNFFDLGGHSLLMVQVHNKLQESLGRNITMVELFQYPTISTLAHHLSETKSEPQQSNVVAESRTRAETRRAALRQRQQSREAQRHQQD
jgi:amino acid adenylation domain-containing protein